MVDLPSEIKKQRVKILSKVSKELADKFNSKFIGSVQKVLLEDVESDYIVGFTDNYIKVYVPISNKLNSGDFVNVKLKFLFNEGCLGEIYE